MAIFVDTPIQFLKGVGPKLGDVLAKRGVTTIGELLEWYPRGYEDRRAARSISSLEPEQQVSLVATVMNVRSTPLGKSRRKMYEVLISDPSGKIACKYFRVPYRGYFQRFQPYQKVRVSGKVINYRGSLEFHHPEIQPFDAEEEASDHLIPLYTETEGLSPGKLRKLLDAAIDKLIDHPEKPKEWKGKKPANFIEPVIGLPEVLPDWVLEKYELETRAKAIKGIHQPASDAGDAYINFRSPAQKRVIFEEFFWLELHLAMRREGVKKEDASPMSSPAKRLEPFLQSLPFELTAAQKRCFKEVEEDLKKPHPMHRLVQGDVGSGKTVVSFLAAIHAADHGFQSAIMVPTEILSEQHYKNACKLLQPIGLRVALLTGQMKAVERREVLEKIASGEVDLIVGTHALIQEDVDFDNLGLVIIDEQHRFGVDQRMKLKSKGVCPHFLVMTATPIPRTLAMTVYGDLDVSVIDELPPGRSPVVTRKTFSNKRDKVFGFVRDQIVKGRQAYVVYPLVEESDKMDLKDAVSEFEKISEMFPELEVGLLHGKMKSAEKEQIMGEFRDNKIQILVSTTVIEVGVDVPNASIMVIEHAERFGLSQLHQLRGRVGRGEHKSYCVLLLGYAVSEEGRQRAEIMEGTTDGFKIAEADLEMRGPGEFIGRRQSGLAGFKLANLVRDTLILQQARQAAFEIVGRDPDLRAPEYALLSEQLKKAEKQIVG